MHEIDQNLKKAMEANIKEGLTDSNNITEPVLERKHRIRGLELKRVEYAEFYQFIKELVSERWEYKIVLTEFTKQ